MGRAGHEIYDSDASLAALADITGMVMREASFWFALEQVRAYTTWLREVLTVIELLVILSQDERVDPHHLMYQDTAIKRWQDVFFEVWDADWDDVYDFMYGRYAYRVAHRDFVSAFFDYLYDLTPHVRWEGDRWNSHIPLVAFQGKLPHFSSMRIPGSDGFEHLGTSEFLRRLLDILIHKIMFILSDENREKSLLFDLYELEEVWVAVDVLGLLTERYQMRAGLDVRTIHRWMDITTGIWIDYIFDRRGITLDASTLSETDELYQNTVVLFVRLMVAVENAIH